MIELIVLNCFLPIALPRLLSALKRENDQPSSYATTILKMSQWGLTLTGDKFLHSIRRMKLFPVVAEQHTQCTPQYSKS
jgi:hypothetical protein